METQNAPVAIFAYNREACLRALLKNLERCVGFEDTQVFIFVDGPKTEKDLAEVEKVRSLALGLDWKNLEVKISEKNKGLKNSIFDGVTYVTKKYGRVIVLEDDLELSIELLLYFNKGLATYEHEPDVFGVCGFMFDVPEFQKKRSTLFLPYANSWGWATWDRAWSGFSIETESYKKFWTEETFQRDFQGPNIMRANVMLDLQFKGLINSWAILWNAYIASKQGMCLFPPQTLIKNAGIGSSLATHSSRFNPANILLSRLERSVTLNDNFAGLDFAEDIAISQSDVRHVAKSWHCRLHKYSSDLGYIKRNVKSALRL